MSRCLMCLIFINLCWQYPPLNSIGEKEPTCPERVCQGWRRSQGNGQDAQAWVVGETERVAHLRRGTGTQLSSVPGLGSWGGHTTG